MVRKLASMTGAAALVAVTFVVALTPAGFSSPPKALCFGKAATIIGTAGNDTIFGTTGSDVIVGLGGHDWIEGGPPAVDDYGDDYICGGDGNDWLFGNAGADRMDGGGGDDFLNAGYRYAGLSCADTENHPTDRHVGNFLYGGPGNDGLVGNSGNDLLVGDEGDDCLFGGYSGQDELQGGWGNDTLDVGWNVYGGLDRDRVDGGPGNDFLDAKDGTYLDVVNGGSELDQCFYDGWDTEVVSNCP